MIWEHAGEIKVYVTEQFYTSEYFIYVYRHISDQETAVLRIHLDGTRSWERIPMGISTPTLAPTYQIERNIARLMVAEMTKQGLRPPDQSKVEGQYEAQGKHLEDLRAVLKQAEIL